MNKAILTIFAAMMLLPHAAHSQHVSGYVRDASTGERLQGVIVLNESRDGTATDKNGYFIIVPGKSGELTFSHLAYRTLAIRLENTRDTVLNISLEPRPTDIDAVEVFARQKAFSLSGNGSISVGTEQMKYAPLFLGEQDVFKYLQLIPGINPGKEGSSGINIRGGGADQTMILLDGVPVYNQSHTFGFLSVFSGDIVSSAELYKGYVPAEYGGRLSGAVSMRTRDGDRQKHRQALAVSIASAALTLEGPIVKGRGSYIVSARNAIPYIILKAYNLYVDPQNKVVYNFHDVTAKAEFDLNARNTLCLSLYTGGDYTRMSIDRETDDGQESSSGGGFRWGNTMASLRLESKPVQNISLRSIAYYTRQNSSMYGDAEITEQGYKYVYDTRIRSYMDEFGLKSFAEHGIDDKLDISYGINGSVQLYNPNDTYTDSNGDKSEKSYGRRKLYSAAVFGSASYKIGNYRIDAGLRGAYYNNGEGGLFSVEPRLSVSGKFGRNTDAWVSYTENTQPIVPSAVTYFSLPMDFWMPYPGRLMQKSRQVSLGGKWAAGRIAISAEAYYKHTGKLALIYDSDDYLTGNGGYDVTKGRAYGAELGVQYEAERYGANVSYTWSRSFRIADGQKRLFEFDVPHVLNVFAHYHTMKKPGRTHTFSINASYRTGIPYIHPNEEFRSKVPFLPWQTAWKNEEGGYEWVQYYSANMPKYPNTRLPDYFRLDLNFNMERVKKNGVRNWQFSVMNVTNRRNPYVIFAEPATGTGNSSEVKYKQLTLFPIIPTVSYRRTF